MEWEARACTPLTDDELAAALTNEIWDDWRSKYSGPSGITLYHYTSASSALKIIQGKELWASEIHYLNDSSELQHAGTILEQALNTNLPRNPDFVKRLKQVAAQFSHGGHPAYFVACFSQQEDDLSQWRAYTPPGAGVALGFDSRRLARFGDRLGFRLCKCLYDHTKQFTIVRKMVDTCHTEWVAQWTAGNKSEAESCVQAFTSGFLNVAATFKHPAFEGEEEWRLVSADMRPTMFDGPSPIKLRDSASILVPYIPVPFKDDNFLA